MMGEIIYKRKSGTWSFTDSYTRLREGRWKAGGMLLSANSQPAQRSEDSEI